MINLQDDEYECAQCKGVFKKIRNEEWSDEKAAEECKKLFGRQYTDSDIVVICDDCFKELRAYHNI